MWRRVALVRTNDSVEHIASLIKMDNDNGAITFTTKSRFLQEPYSVTSQRREVHAVKASNLT
jgi:hypothetical protein